MKNEYINELFMKLENTEIWQGTAGKCGDYEEGIQLLIQVFTEHKRKQSRLFFFGNGGSSAIASHMTADFMKNGGMNTACMTTLSQPVWEMIMDMNIFFQSRWNF